MFICAPVLLCLEGIVSLVFPIAALSYNGVPPLQSSLNYDARGLMETSRLGQCPPAIDEIDTETHHWTMCLE